jgi:hypothetical protein
VTEDQIRAEADEATRVFAAAVAARESKTTGVPKPMEIVVTQTETEPIIFGIALQTPDPSAVKEGEIGT